MQRSVTEIRRSRTGRPSVSTGCITQSVLGTRRAGAGRPAPSSLRAMPRADAPILALVAVTAIWGYTFVPVQKAVGGVSALRASSPCGSRSRRLALAPFAWRPLRTLPRAGWSRALGAGELPRAAYGLQTAGLELTTVSSTGFITGLYVVLTPLLALALFRTPVPAAAWVGVALSLAGLLLLSGAPGRLRGSATCSCSGTPSRSRSRSWRWSGSRRATTLAR